MKNLITRKIYFEFRKASYRGFKVYYLIFFYFFIWIIEIVRFKYKIKIIKLINIKFYNDLSYFNKL